MVMVKKLPYKVILLTILAVPLIILFWFKFESRNQLSLATPNGTVNLLLADTLELRQRGLSNRAGLDKNSGMLFIFDDVSKQNCFWMKDMSFSIDMVWLNEQRGVISVIPNVAPETYPSSYCPEKPAKYGLEINAGRAENFGIKNGVYLQFKDRF